VPAAKARHHDASLGESAAVKNLKGNAEAETAHKKSNSKKEESATSKKGAVEKKSGKKKKKKAKTVAAQEERPGLPKVRHGF